MTQQVAARLKVRESSVRIWAAQGRFKGAKKKETPIGSYWIIPEAAVRGFEKRGRGRPRKDANPKSSKKRAAK